MKSDTIVLFISKMVSYVINLAILAVICGLIVGMIYLLYLAITA